MSYRSNQYRKYNPRWATGNSAETKQLADITYDSLTPRGSRLAAAANWVGNTCGNCIAWLIGRQRRVGARLHAAGDAEARWWHWDVTENRGGLGRQYRDARFAAPRQADLSPATPDCQCPGDR